MSKLTFKPSWRVIAKTPPGENIISLAECGGQIFAATSGGAYRLAQRRKGQYLFVPVLFSSAPKGEA